MHVNRIGKTVVFALVGAFLICVAGCSKGDLSTPKGAAKSFANAIERGDADGAKAASTGGDPKTIEGLAKMGGSMKKLRDAAVSKFGEQGKSMAGADGMGDMSKKVDEATEKIDGDTATLQSPGKSEPLKLKKVSGEWRVDVSEMFGPAFAMGAGMFDSMSKAASDTADEINAGKYKTAAEAQQAFQQKMMGGMMLAPGQKPGG